MSYPISVECPFWGRHGRKLRSMGLRWDGESHVGLLSARAYRRAAAYCERERIRYRLDNGFGDRGAGYRRAFFAAHPPHTRAGKYYCAYCGRKMARRAMTVDHIWPVDAASKDPAVQRRLRRMGCRSVNDPRNLAAACRRCNERKGAKTGWWVARGMIGRHPAVWRARAAARLALAAALAYAAAGSGAAQEIARLLF